MNKREVAEAVFRYITRKDPSEAEVIDMMNKLEAEASSAPRPITNSQTEITKLAAKHGMAKAGRKIRANQIKYIREATSASTLIDWYEKLYEKIKDNLDFKTKEAKQKYWEERDKRTEFLLEMIRDKKTAETWLPIFARQLNQDLGFMIGGYKDEEYIANRKNVYNDKWYRIAIFPDETYKFDDNDAMEGLKYLWNMMLEVGMTHKKVDGRANIEEKKYRYERLADVYGYSDIGEEIEGEGFFDGPGKFQRFINKISTIRQNEYLNEQFLKLFNGNEDNNQLIDYLGAQKTADHIETLTLRTLNPNNKAYSLKTKKTEFALKESAKFHDAQAGIMDAIEEIFKDNEIVVDKELKKLEDFESFVKTKPGEKQLQKVIKTLQLLDREVSIDTIKDYMLDGKEETEKKLKRDKVDYNYKQLKTISKDYTGQVQINDRILRKLSEEAASIYYDPKNLTVIDDIIKDIKKGELTGFDDLAKKPDYESYINNAQIEYETENRERSERLFSIKKRQLLNYIKRGGRINKDDARFKTIEKEDKWFAKDLMRYQKAADKMEYITRNIMTVVDESGNTFYRNRRTGDKVTAGQMAKLTLSLNEFEAFDKKLMEDADFEETQITNSNPYKRSSAQRQVTRFKDVAKRAKLDKVNINEDLTDIKKTRRAREYNMHFAATREKILNERDPERKDRLAALQEPVQIPAPLEEPLLIQEDDEKIKKYLKQTS